VLYLSIVNQFNGKLVGNMENKSYGHIFDNSVTEIPMGEDGKPYSIDLSIAKSAPELLVEILNSIPEDSFYLARFIADDATMDIIQDKLPGWYEKLRVHAEQYQSGNK